MEKSAKAVPPKFASNDGGPFPKHYVYILRSLLIPDRTYTGHTDHPKQRLQEHNQKQCKHTAKYTPWRMETLVGFTDSRKALAFEQYLKTGSGRAFQKGDRGRLARMCWRPRRHKKQLRGTRSPATETVALLFLKANLHGCSFS